MAQAVENLPAVRETQETWAGSLGRDGPLEKGMSCLENPMDRGAWWATVHGVAKSQTCPSTGMHTYDLQPGLPAFQCWLLCFWTTWDWWAACSSSQGFIVLICNIGAISYQPHRAVMRFAWMNALEEGEKDPATVTCLINITIALIHRNPGDQSCKGMRFYRKSTECRDRCRNVGLPLPLIRFMTLSIMI